MTHLGQRRAKPTLVLGLVTAAVFTAMSGVSLGSLLGPPLGGCLFQWGGYRLPFLTAGILVGLVGVVLLVALPDSRPADRPAPRDRPVRDGRLLVTAGAVVLGATVL